MTHLGLSAGWHEASGADDGESGIQRGFYRPPRWTFGAGVDHGFGVFNILVKGRLAIDFRRAGFYNNSMVLSSSL
jgi:hypothetical protein